MPPMKKRPAQKPRPPLPKSTNSKYPIALGNYADFLQKEFQNPYPPTKPPLQLIPRRSQPQDSGKVFIEKSSGGRFLWNRN